MFSGGQNIFEAPPWLRPWLSPPVSWTVSTTNSFFYQPSLGISFLSFNARSCVSPPNNWAYASNRK